MKIYKSDELTKFTERPGLTGLFAHGENLTLTQWVFEKDAVLASHSHPHEQITYIISGSMRFDREDGSSETVEAGSFTVFASNEIHGGQAIVDGTTAIDAFSPAREDFKAATGWKE